MRVFTSNLQSGTVNQLKFFSSFKNIGCTKINSMDIGVMGWKKATSQMSMAAGLPKITAARFTSSFR